MNKKEVCVCCGKETNVDINTHLDFRDFYIEGSGQLCSECYHKTYGNEPKQLVDYCD